MEHTAPYKFVHFWHIWNWNGIFQSWKYSCTGMQALY